MYHYMNFSPTPKIELPSLFYDGIPPTSPVILPSSYYAYHYDDNDDGGRRKVPLYMKIFIIVYVIHTIELGIRILSSFHIGHWMYKFTNIELYKVMFLRQNKWFRTRKGWYFWKTTLIMSGCYKLKSALKLQFAIAENGNV